MAFSLFALRCRAPEPAAGGGAVSPALRLGPLEHAALPALQALYAAQHAPAPVPDLAGELGDAARGHGRQAVLAWRGRQPVGCAGWVGFSIARDGLCFGAPVLAADREVAEALLAHLQAQARHLGARRLRISAWTGEHAKRAALAAAGFVHQFEWMQFALATAGTSPVDFAARGWRRVPLADVDWPQLAALYATTFREVPNAPLPDLASLQAEWQEADWDAGCVLADTSGRYRAFCLIDAGAVEAVGVDPALRGQGIAALLYQHAGHSLARRGSAELSALVASSNSASLRLHQKLGFHEAQPRGAVYELTLAQTSHAR